jgi:DNA polymerase I-like protein with 3'-5' exonuclease and polymerase domains|tara:strand:+ start:3738 stop:5747 length:2010 start_codon:yes stop_codon:yes gene_type:complete
MNIPQPSEIEIESGETVAIDLETYDPQLKTHGSGAIIGKGKVCGIALAYGDKKLYIPIRHLYKGQNLDPKMTWKRLNKILFQRDDVKKVFHNAMYDVCWIRKESGLMPKGPIYDTMVAASVIDENRTGKKRYTLDSLSRDYLGETKYKNNLEEIPNVDDPMSNMHKLSWDQVREYAEQDVSLTLRLWDVFKKLIKKPISTDTKNVKTLENIFDLETRLFPCLVEMRFKGVRIDEKRTKTFGKELEDEREKILDQIKKETGVEILLWSADSFEPLLKQQNITDYKVTPKTGRPSITKLYLESHTNKYLKLIAKARQLDKLHNTFVTSILKYSNKGRIHADINQIRSDQGGTVTGRFSMSNPNLQQIPARTEQGSKIRELFLPEEKHKWASFDYSQQEPRLVVHYALKLKDQDISGAMDMAERYNKDPDTDFHDMVADMASITRKQAKTINLGLFYGMGKNKLARSLELETEEAKDLFDQYHKRVPFVRQLANSLQKYAEENKQIYTLEDRFCRFNKWEPRDKYWNAEEGRFVVQKYKDDENGVKQIMEEAVPILDGIDEAKDYYKANRSLEQHKQDPFAKNFESFCQPAFTYKALNRLIQGSAADMTKKAMVLLFEEGIVPHIQIHDELCFSIESEEQAEKIKTIMENAIKLEVPNKVDYESGPNWGTIK